MKHSPRIHAEELRANAAGSRLVQCAMEKSEPSEDKLQNYRILASVLASGPSYIWPRLVDKASKNILDARTRVYVCVCACVRACVWGRKLSREFTFSSLAVLISMLFAAFGSWNLPFCQPFEAFGSWNLPFCEPLAAFRSWNLRFWQPFATFLELEPFILNAICSIL